MIWSVSHRFDPAALPMADRHYNRRKVGSPQFVPPGRNLVLRCDRALWVTSWPFAEYVRHAWPEFGCIKRVDDPAHSYCRLHRES